MAARRGIASSSSESESALPSHDESGFDSESESLSDASMHSQELGDARSNRRGNRSTTKALDNKARPFAPFKHPTGSSGSLWSSREKQFESFRSGLVTLPLPDGVQRIEKARGYSLHVMSVLNWVLPESILTLHSTTNQFQHGGDGDDSDDGEDDLILTVGAHVSMFHAPSKRFFGNTWVSPELPVDPGQIKQRQTSKNSSLSYVVENALLNFRAYFFSDVVDPNCVGIVELVAYQKDPDSKATVMVTGCGWTIVPLFSRSEKGSAAAPPSAFSMEASGQSVNVFVGSPRVLWELAPSSWNSQEVLENCKLFYQLAQYEPVLSISMFLRRNELVGALDVIPGLKNGNLANIDVGRNPKMLLWEEQDSTYEEALATFVKLASLVPKTVAVEESFEVAVTALRVAIHLRQKVESDLIARLKISRRAIHDGATSIEGEVSARVLKIALHNGRCFRTRQHTVPLKVDQAGDDMLRCVSNRTRLKGFVFHPYLAIVLVLQFTVHFRLEWPAKLKQAAIDAKRPLPPEEDVVLVTIGSRAIVPSDGKKLYLYDKHHHATALSAQPMVMGWSDERAPASDDRGQRVLHVDLLSGAPCRPYSDNTLYTPPMHAPQLRQAGAALSDTSISYCDIKIEPGEYKGAPSTDTTDVKPVEISKEANAAVPTDAVASNNQLSDAEDGEKEAEGRAAVRWAKKLLDKANNNSLLAQVLDTLADSPSENQQQPTVTPLVLPSPTGKLSTTSKPSPTKQKVPEPISLPSNYRNSELSRASKTLLSRYGYMDGIGGRDVSSSPSNQDTTMGRSKSKKTSATPAKTLEQELNDVYKANEIRFHFAALRTFTYTDRSEPAPAFAATRVYFTFQFYNFAPTRTEPLRLSDAFDNGSGGETKTLLLMREKPADKPSLAIQFEVDTSATMNPLETRQFAEYLLTKSLYVDVWDADSLFLLGTFAIPLHELLRQGAGVKKFQTEIDILEPIDVGDDTVDAGANDENVAASRVLDVDGGFDCRGKSVVAKIQLLMSNYGLKGENRLDQVNASSNQQSTIDASKNLDATASTAQRKHRVRARLLVESNPDLHRLLSQEGFYRSPNGRAEDKQRSSKRRERVGGTSDATTLSPKEISILCDLFRSRKPSASGQASSRILCDRDGKTGLVALFSLHPTAALAPSDSGSKTTSPTAVSAVIPEQKTPRPATKSNDLDEKQRAAADRLQRIMRVASKNKVALEDAFQLFDSDGDDFLSHTEFVKALRSLGDAFSDASDEDLIALASSMDANKDGKVDYAEFGAFLTRNQTSQERADVWRDRIKCVISRATEKGVRVHHVFAQLDSSGDGKLSLDEFESALKQLGVSIDMDSEGLRGLLAEFDADHDGRISYQEFVQSLGISLAQNRAEVVADTTKDIVARVREVMKRLEARGVNMDDAFVHFDMDKNGSLSMAEFTEAMNQLLQSDVAALEADGSSAGDSLKSLEREAALAIMKGVNADGDDKIDYKEFLTFCGVSRDNLSQKEAERRRAKVSKAEKKLVKLIVRASASGMKTSDIFQHFDANADGDISLTEFRRSFEQLFQGQDLEADDALQIAARFDRNSDGKISFQEFQSFGEEIVRNQHALLALLMPHIDKLSAKTSDTSSGLMREQQWRVLCRGQLKLVPKQMAAIQSLMAYFSLVDDSGTVGLAELLSLLNSVPSSSTATVAAPSAASAPADPPIERLNKLLLRAKDQGVDLKSSFAHFDTDGSGEITREELRRGLLALGIFNDMAEPELDSLLDQLDANASGKISFHEFSVLVQSGDKSSPGEKSESSASKRDDAIAKLRRLIAMAIEKGVSVESCFSHFDKNQDGKISSKEFAAAMVELGLATTDQDALLEEAAKSLDRDGSGEVDLAEFRQLFPDNSSSETSSKAPPRDQPKDRTPQTDATPRCDGDEPSDASVMASVTTDQPLPAVTTMVDRLRSLLLAAQAGGVDIQTCFAHFDTDGDGSITSEEFVSSLRQLAGFEAVPEEEIRVAVVAALDTNASGSISLSEFRAFLTSGGDSNPDSLVKKDATDIDASSAKPEGTSDRIASSAAAANSDSHSETSKAEARDPSIAAATSDEPKGTQAAANAEGGNHEIKATSPESSVSTSAGAPAVDSMTSPGDCASLPDKPPCGEEVQVTADARANKEDDGKGGVAVEAGPTAKPTKSKPPMNRGSSFGGAARGKPRLGVRPSLAAARRSQTDPESIQAAADGVKAVETLPNAEQAPQEQDGAAVVDKPAARAKTTRRPSFASSRAAASKRAEAAGDPKTAVSDDASKSNSQSAESPASSAAAAAVPAQVESSVTSLRALLVAAQKSGVDVQMSFDHFDKDRNGQLTHDEFTQGLRELGEEFRALSDELIAEVARVLDRDQRGEISVQDLVAFINASDPVVVPSSTPEQPSRADAAVSKDSNAESIVETSGAVRPAPQSKTPRATPSSSVASTAAARRRSSMSSTASKAPSCIERRASNASTTKPVSEHPPLTERSSSTAVPQQPASSSSAGNANPSAPIPTNTSSSSGNPPSVRDAGTTQDTSGARASLVEDCAYSFNQDPEVRAVELKLRRAAVDAYSRGILPLRLLNKFLDDDDYSSTRFRTSAKTPKRQRTELLRVEFLQVLMELGFNLQSDLSSGGDDRSSSSSSRGRYSGCATRMNDHLYARQLERLSRYRRHIKSDEHSRAQKQLVRAATTSSSGSRRGASQADDASLQRFADDKQQLLRVLSYYRDGQKKGLVYSLLREQVTTSVPLFPAFAELLFLELPFRNPYNHSERFRVELLPPTDAERARVIDMDVVRSGAEWSFYRRHLPLAFPVSASSPTDEDDRVESEMIDGQNEFVMDAHDALRVPMRLRWLDALPSVRTARVRSQFTAQRSEEEEDDGCGAVPVSVMVKSCSHGHTVALFKLALRPQPLVCHRVLRFSHPAGSIWRWKLRCPPGAFLVCMDPRVAVDTLTGTSSSSSGGVDVDGAEDSVVSFKCRVGEYPSLEQFHVVLYGDRCLAKVLETWQVRVQSRLRVDAHAVAGQRATSELVIRTPDDDSDGGGPHGAGRRLVQCFTRAKDAEHAQFRPSRVFQLAPRAFNRIELAYCSVGKRGVLPTAAVSTAAAPPASTDVVLVNLVDVERRELVGAWSVRVTLAPPRATKTFALAVSAAAGAQKKIAYANPWDEPQVVVLRSSAPLRMAPRESELRVPAHGRVFLRLVFSPAVVVDASSRKQMQTQMQTQQTLTDEAMYLFINDKPTDENEECLLFHVTYV